MVHSFPLLAKSIALIAAFVPLVAASDNQCDSGSYLEPSVARIQHVVTSSECNAIIEAAEDEGFPLTEESIDYGEDNSRFKASQQIDVVEEGEVVNPQLWELIKPLLPRMTEIVQKRKLEMNVSDELLGNKLPSADWVFLRKYSPTTQRNSLRLHYDVNLHTVNVALSDNYEGGGLFYVKPPLDYQDPDSESAAPLLPNKYLTYEWLEQLKRENTSMVVFPTMETGDVVIHNYTVWHAIAPLEEGTKYSLLLFFDMDNPAVEMERQYEYEDESEDEEEDYESGGFLEPSVARLEHVVTSSECKTIIEAAEEEGFPLNEESIDYGENATRYKASQQIDVVVEGEVVNSQLWELIKPLLPRMTEIVKKRKLDMNVPDELLGNKLPSADWVFLRKYSPTTQRNSLRLHYDVNLHTVNVALSDNYEGGGLFYVKPPLDYQEPDSEWAAPLLPNKYLTYEWLEQIKRENTSMVVFPTLETGDVVIHNYTVWHAIAPIEEGTKYSLLLFFDMDNPAVEMERQYEYEDESEDEEEDYESGGFLEPSVARLEHVVTSSECKTIIEAAEEEGFPLNEESIDYGEDNSRFKASQQIDVVEEGEVVNPQLWELIKPLLPRMTEIVKKRKLDMNVSDELLGNKLPSADWVFLRKYSPTTQRNSLRLHYDINLHTVNVALSDNYEGGGLFYVKPPLDYQDPDSELAAPSIPDKYLTYEWLEHLKRENTSMVVFPTMETGDVVIHNYTVWHAIAPIEKGTKYSLVFFFDMDNPAVASDRKFVYSYDSDNQEDDDEEDDDKVEVMFYHEVTDEKVDLFWVDGEVPESHPDKLSVVDEDVQPFEEVSDGTYVGHTYRFIGRKTGRVIGEFPIVSGKDYYAVTSHENQEL